MVPAGFRGAVDVAERTVERSAPRSLVHLEQHPRRRGCEDPERQPAADRRRDAAELDQPLPDLQRVVVQRSEERRVGKGCASKCSYRWSPYLYNKKTKYIRVWINNKDTSDIKQA